MAHLNPEEAYADLRQQVLTGIRHNFPLNTKLKNVELHGLEVQGEDKGADDIRAQHKARVAGRSWQATVVGDLSLRDADTGKLLDRRKMRLANIPMVTARNTFIIDGREKQAQNQWRLMPGVYTRRTGKGVLESRFNTPSQREFSVRFDPKNKLFKMARGSSKAIPVYPLMKELGVDDDTLERTWGRDILNANKTARGQGTALTKFYTADKRRKPDSDEEARQHFLETMSASDLEPDAVAKTLGTPYAHVDGNTMRDATKKILSVHRGAPEDDRDSLLFKHLLSMGDYAHERLVDKRTVNGIRGKVSRKAFKGKDLRDVVRFDMFNDPVKAAFTDSGDLVSSPQQINPVEMLRGAQQTTIMGKGGVQSQNVIDAMTGAKLVNRTHMGLLDPVRTPEGGKTGVTLSLPLGVRKRGKLPTMPLYNLRRNKMEHVSAAEFSRKNVVLPDQVRWKGDKPVPKSKKVRASGVDNEPTEITMSDAHYVMRHPSQLFSVTTNLIPFLGNNSGNRASYAGQQIEQAISLRKRQAPLVQVKTPSSMEGMRTFEELVGGRASHRSSVGGTVLDVNSDRIVVMGGDKKPHTIDLYNNFPLNDPKLMMHSTPLPHIKRGARVKPREVVADTNFTRGGQLALGTNLRVSYLPYKGYNFEDGVVISKSASEKLASEHLHKPDIDLSGGLARDAGSFQLLFSDEFAPGQYKKLDSNGVVKKGQRVRTGDPLVLASRPYQARDAVGLGRIGKALTGRHTDRTLRWKSDYEGEVVGVHETKKGLAVHVRTLENMQVGDKIAGRHGNKGIVTRVLDDEKMPQIKGAKKDEAHVEVALNPSGVPGRMNVGQVLETAASKIAKKTGKTYMVENFDGTSQVEHIKAELKKHGLSEQDELIDPDTGRSLGKALTGPQHMLKLHQQIDKKNSVRSGMALPGGEEEPESYDINLMPSGGGKSGGMRIGGLDHYALLAHGAKANIREMQTWKSEGPDPQQDPSKHHETQHATVWDAIQSGGVYPMPRPTFSYKKFQGMLTAAGINLQKKGHHLQLSPLTNAEVLRMSSGEVKKPYEMVDAKLDEHGDYKPRKDGIFDKDITGGHGGVRWSHIKMAEAVPNPVFETPIQKLTGLKGKDFEAIVGGEKSVDKKGRIVDLDTPGSVTGGPAIGQLLSKINVDKDLAAAEKELSAVTLTASGVAHQTSNAAKSRADNLVKKVKYLRALKQLGASPKDAYMLENLPVMPPSMRPPSTLDDGNVKWQDINELYSGLGQINVTLRDPKTKQQPEEFKRGLRAEYYDGVRALMGHKISYDDATHKGILHQIKGSAPKKGYFQSVMTSRRQDMSMRSTIVPEPSLEIDEVGLPKSRAMTLFKPFVVRKLVEMGAASDVPQARQLMTDYSKGQNTQTVENALKLVAEERPIMLKRDPVLHKHSVQGFKARLVPGKAIQIHPLVTGGYNADFDGDQMSAYVPISDEARKEVRRMMPSQNLYSEASGRVMYQPSLESALGLYKLSNIGKDSKKTFKSAAQMATAVNDGKLSVNDLAMVGGKKTTMGRLLIAQALPESALRTKIVTDRKYAIDSDGLDAMYMTIAKDKRMRGEFGKIADRLKDLGYGAAYGAVPIYHDKRGVDAVTTAERGLKYVHMPTHSINLDDFMPDRATRDPLLEKAQQKVDRVRANKKLNKEQQDSQVAEIWTEASKTMDAEHKKKVRGGNLLMMHRAGVKPSFDQYKQMVLAPVIVDDASGKPILQPIKRGYGEGLDVSEYWTQQQGARRGAVMKTQEVRDPGVFSKYTTQTTMNMVVTEPDCETQQGVGLHISKDSAHVQDRILAKGVNLKGASFSAGTELTPDVVSRIRTANKNEKIMVRSPLKCELGDGLCAACAGTKASGGKYELGTNVGILAAQSAAERSIQLTMKQFHTGGVRTSGGAGAVSDFDRVQQLVKLPRSVPNAAKLAAKAGTVERVERTPTGTEITVGGVRHFVDLDPNGKDLHKDLPGAAKDERYKPWTPPVVGMQVKAGQTLTDPNRTVINPRDLYRSTNSIAAVKNHMVDELSSIYGKDVRRQHIETMVRAMGNLTKVRDEGDADGVLRGDYAPASKIEALNKRLVKAGKRPVEHSPVLMPQATLPLEATEDWAAKLQHIHQHQTLTDAVAIGARSNLHGTHPIPGIMYGAEFGLTGKDSLKPGLERLRDVKATSY